MRRFKSLLTTLALTGALVGGGAAIATAATSSGSSTATTTSSAHTTAPQNRARPAPGKAGSGMAGHNCPNMGKAPAA
jgi:hypothetical protein